MLKTPLSILKADLLSDPSPVKLNKFHNILYLMEMLRNKGRYFIKEFEWIQSKVNLIIRLERKCFYFLFYFAGRKERRTWAVNNNKNNKNWFFPDNIQPDECILFSFFNFMTFSLQWRTLSSKNKNVPFLPFFFCHSRLR